MGSSSTARAGRSFGSTDSQRAQTHTWLTPKRFISELGPFDFDPCAAPKPRPFATARRMNSESDGDGLAMSWSGRVWLNPPYGAHAQRWVERLEEHGNGIALLFARLDTKWLQPIIERNGVFLLAGRIRFLKRCGSPAENDAGAPSCLIPFGRFNVGKVLCSSLAGVWKQ